MFSKCRADTCPINKECDRYVADQAKLPKGETFIIPQEQGENCGYFWPTVPPQVKVRVKDASQD